MYTNPFHTNMSSLEAQEVLFSLSDKITDPKEREQIKADYTAVVPSILHKELNAGLDVMTSYPV